MAFPANASGPIPCPACGERIYKGQLIISTYDGYRHQQCPDDPKPLQRPVCPKCWLERSVSGACGCIG